MLTVSGDSAIRLHAQVVKVHHVAEAVELVAATVSSEPPSGAPAGGPLSADAVQRLVAKHVASAQTICPTLASKHISTHNLRHSVAMDLLHRGLDVAVVATWLGHEKLESVNAYVHADPTLKQRALDRLTPINPSAKTGRYKASDDLLAFLDSL